MTLDRPLPAGSLAQSPKGPVLLSEPETAKTPRRWSMFTGSYVAVILGLLLTLAVVGFSAVLALRNTRALEAASHSQDIRALVADLVLAVTDAETGQRGFLLTGEPSYLAPYQRGTRAAPDMLHRLSSELASEPDFAPVLARLEEVVGGKLAELAQTIEAARAGQRDEALALVRSGRGQQAMDEIRLTTDRLAARQQVSLAEQLDRVERAGRWMVAIDTLGLLLLVLLAAGIIWGTRRALAVLRAAQADLASANAELAGVNERLEHKVAQRTEDLTMANDEIQRFAYIVSHDLRAPLVNITGFTSELESATRTIAKFVGQHTFVDQHGVEPPAAALAEVTVAVSEDLPEAIRFIKASTTKMDRLIAAILKLSREGRRVIHPEPIEMRGFLSGIADTLQHQDRGQRRRDRDRGSTRSDYRSFDARTDFQQSSGECAEVSLRRTARPCHRERAPARRLGGVRGARQWPRHCRTGPRARVRAVPSFGRPAGAG